MYIFPSFDIAVATIGGGSDYVGHGCGNSMVGGYCLSSVECRVSVVRVAVYPVLAKS